MASSRSRSSLATPTDHGSVPLSLQSGVGSIILPGVRRAKPVLAVSKCTGQALEPPEAARVAESANGMSDVGVVVRRVEEAGAICTLQASDLSAAHQLSCQAGWNQTPADWQRLLAWEPEGCFVLALDGAIAGTVTTTRYGSRLAWIGMLLVDAALRRRGFGQRLLLHALSWLGDTGVGVVMLDATPLGQPLYERLGFRPQCLLDRWQGVASAAVSGRRTSKLGPAGLSSALLDLDQRAFGLDRSRLLRDLQTAPKAQSIAIGAVEATSGYVLLRPGSQCWHVGPLVAEDGDTAERLLQAALAALDGQPVEVDVPRLQAAQEIVRRAGLSPARPFVRMLRGGPAPPVDWSLIYASAAPEIG